MGGICVGEGGHLVGVEVVRLDSVGTGRSWSTQGPRQEVWGLDLVGTLGTQFKDCLAKGKRKK